LTVKWGEDLRSCSNRKSGGRNIAKKKTKLKGEVAARDVHILKNLQEKRTIQKDDLPTGGDR